MFVYSYGYAMVGDGQMGRPWCGYPDLDVPLNHIRTAHSLPKRSRMEADSDLWLPIGLFPGRVLAERAMQGEDFCPVWLDGDHLAVLLRRCFEYAS